MKRIKTATFMRRSYYSESTSTFLNEAEIAVMGKLALYYPFDVTDLQKNSWLYQIRFLQHELSGYNRGHVFFEFAIPRMGKRVDNVVVLDGVIFVIEFKVGAEHFHGNDIDQVMDYALDLKNFHSASREAPIVPVLIATRAPPTNNVLEAYQDKICNPLKTNEETFGPCISETLQTFPSPHIDPYI